MRRNNQGTRLSRMTATGFHRRVTRPYMRRIRRATFRRRGVRPRRITRRRGILNRRPGIFGTNHRSRGGVLAPSEAKGITEVIRQVNSFKVAFKPYQDALTNQEANFSEWTYFPIRTQPLTFFPALPNLSYGVQEQVRRLSQYKYWKLKGVKAWLRNVTLTVGLTTHEATSDPTKPPGPTIQTEWVKPNCQLKVRCATHIPSTNGPPYFTIGEFDHAKSYTVKDGKMFGSIPIAFAKVNQAQPYSDSGAADKWANFSNIASGYTYNLWGGAWNLITKLENGFGPLVGDITGGTGFQSLGGKNKTSVMGGSSITALTPCLGIAVMGIPNRSDLAGVVTPLTNEPIQVNVTLNADVVTECIISAWGDWTDNSPFPAPPIPKIQYHGTDPAPSIVLPGSTSDPDPTKMAAGSTDKPPTSPTDTLLITQTSSSYSQSFNGDFSQSTCNWCDSAESCDWDCPASDTSASESGSGTLSCEEDNDNAMDMSDHVKSKRAKLL